MKKLIFLFLTIIYLSSYSQNIKATLKIKNTDNIEFTTDLFQLIFYGNVQLAGPNPNDSTRWIGDGYDIILTYYGDNTNNRSHLMAYCYVGADCTTTLKIWEQYSVIKCEIKEIKINEAMIIITARAISKLILEKGK